MSAFQTVVLGDKDSDCKSKHYMTTVLDNTNKKLLMNRYFLDGNKLTELNSDNVDEYIGKLLKFRSPMYCQSEKICNKCAGELPYDMGIKNMGLLVNQVAQAIVTGSMKSFHDMTIRMNEIDIDEYIN